MPIAAGDKIPSVTLKRLGAEGMEDINFAEYVAGKRVVIFGVPGAFTPTCAQKHLPSYIEKIPEFSSKGIQEIICVAVNDPFVMNHWSKISGAEGKITMMPDGNGELTKAMDLVLDGSGAGLGQRSQRYSMVVNDGTVENVEIESNPGEMSVSGADVCVTKL